MLAQTHGAVGALAMQDSMVEFSEAAGKFARLMEKHAVRGVSEDGQGIQSSRFIRPKQVEGESASLSSHAVSLADRILANVSPGRTPVGAWRTPGPVEGVAPSLSTDSDAVLHLMQRQLQFTKSKTEIGLAAAGVQKCTQGLDTLLKAQ